MFLRMVGEYGPRACLGKGESAFAEEADKNQGPYSPTISKNILCFFLQDFQIGM